MDPLFPTETVEMENGLSLSPRVKLLLTFFRADPSVKPVDDWKLKRSLIDFFSTSFSVPISLPDEDLRIRRFKDLQKRRRDDPVAHGTLVLRDLRFLAADAVKGLNGGVDDTKALETIFSDWKTSLVVKMDGMGLSIEGVRYKLSVAVPSSDGFDGMRKEWEECYAFGDRGQSRGGRQQPDTIVLRGVPSRWFAEPRVSSKPSMLVTHTIFSRFGKIRNLNVAEDDDPGKNQDDGCADIVSSLLCKIVVQFEKYQDFYRALKVLCGRSLQKQGSRLKADYEVTWDRDDYFGVVRNRYLPGKNSQVLTSGRYEHEGLLKQPLVPRFSSDVARSKRFKEQGNEGQ